MSALGGVAGVGVAQAEDGDRKLVAARSFAAGQVVLDEEPYCSVLLDHQVRTHCHHTFRCCEKLLRCSRCGFARYGSRESQAAAWATEARQECTALAACSPRVPPPTIRLVARLLWRSSGERSKGAHQQADAIAGLLDHWEELAAERMLTYAQMAHLTLEFMQGGGTVAELPPAKEVAQLLAKIACNCMTIADEELRPVGTGLYLTGAMANHSCSPSCVQSFQGNRLVLRALRPVAKGEPLTISYIELAATRQERRHSLLQGYFFDIDGTGAPPGPLPLAARDAGQTSPSPSSSSPASSSASSSASAFASGGGRGAKETEFSGSQGISLRVFTSRDQPPWRTDAVDADMTAVCVKGVRGAVLMHGRVLEDTKAGERGVEAIASDLLEPGWKSAPAEIYCIVEAGGAELSSPGSLIAAANNFGHLLRVLLRAEACLTEGNYGEALQLASSQLSSQAAAILGRFHIIRLRLLRALQRAAIENSQWPTAAQASQELTPLLQHVYPER
mmetsp:Transcript_37672/g.106431  ORF Transcript_37672/g.106431 Transcript_37672/m.106431 type:complete len:504 (+) Transcript_37672:48-1559(+)